MNSSKTHHVQPLLRRTLLTALVVAMPCAAVSAAASSPDAAPASVTAAARAQAVSAWHDTIQVQGAPGTGCFTASFPSNVWTAEACAPEPKLISSSRPHAVVDPITGNVSRVTAQAAGGTFTTGNGNDYAAKTASLTRGAVGTFPTVTGVTSGSQDYSLQINTNIDNNPTTCSQFGYSACQTWEQFIYATDDGSGNASAFIQNWFFATNASEYRSRGCPSGWYSYPDDQACYRNSQAVYVAYVPITQIGGVRLAGTANQNGKDVVTFTINGTAHTVSESASTLNIGKIWNKSEFNIFGNDSSQPLASFNRGSRVNVHLAVDDGSTRAPTCLQGAGTTFEQNNLALGACTATAGSAPAIQFNETN